MYTDEQLAKLVEKLKAEDVNDRLLYQAIDINHARNLYQPPETIGLLQRPRQHYSESGTYLLELIVKRTYTVFGELEPTYILHPAYEHLNELFKPSQLQTLGKLIHKKIKRLENDSNTSNEDRTKARKRQEVREMRDFINTVLK